MTKTILVLGAGVATAPFIRQTMRTTVLNSSEYNLIVVTPNSHFLWPVAMPRAVVPGQLSDDQVLLDLQPLFKDYPASKFEFILGAASEWNPDSNTVTVAVNDGSIRSIEYHSIVIGTGASAKESMPWKVVANTETTKERLHTLQKEIEGAKTIVVAGGGLTGTETAGELGFEYGKSGKKEIYFVHSDSLPLAPPVIESVRKASKAELEKMGVKLIPNSSVTSVAKNGNDTVIQLRSKDGSEKTLTAQVYLPTFGVIPNSSFAPANLLDSKGYIKQTESLGVEGYANAFVVGDVGNLEENKAMLADTQTAHLIKSFPVYLNGGKVATYQKNTKNMNALSLGRSRGAGHFNNFKLFSILVYYAKGKTLGVDKAPGIAAGKQGLMTVFEK